MACHAGGCFPYCHHDCKFYDSANFQVHYNTAQIRKAQRIARRCYSQYYRCLRIWAAEAEKQQIPTPTYESMVESACKAYGWPYFMALSNFIDLFGNKMFKNRKVKDYVVKPRK